MKKILLLSLLVLSACGEDRGPKDYLKIAGGGITFNYRYSQAGMVVIAQQKSPLPEGSIVEALFDQPAQSARQSSRLPAIEGKLTYKLQSDVMTGFKKGGEYKVTIRLLDKTGKELDRDDRIFISDEDQSTLPSKPIVEGLEFTPHLENIKPSP
jgi:hypothetical protein